MANSKRLVFTITKVRTSTDIVFFRISHNQEDPHTEVIMTTPDTPIFSRNKFQWSPQLHECVRKVRDVIKKLGYLNFESIFVKFNQEYAFLKDLKRKWHESRLPISTEETDFFLNAFSKLEGLDLGKSGLSWEEVTKGSGVVKPYQYLGICIATKLKEKPRSTYLQKGDRLMFYTKNKTVKVHRESLDDKESVFFNRMGHLDDKDITDLTDPDDILKFCTQLSTFIENCEGVERVIGAGNVEGMVYIKFK